LCRAPYVRRFGAGSYGGGTNDAAMLFQFFGVNPSLGMVFSQNTYSPSPMNNALDVQCKESGTIASGTASMADLPCGGSTFYYSMGFDWVLYR